MEKLYLTLAILLGFGITSAYAQENNLTCADVCACVDADNDGAADDLVCCLPTAEGETPVLGDLENDGDACGCAEIGPAALIAGRISDQTAVQGCTQVNGATAVTLDPGAGVPIGVPANDEQCKQVAAEACVTGNPDTCRSVSTDDPSCSSS